MHSVQDPVYLATLEKRFAAAARHSRLVRLLRRAVPAAIAVALLLIVVASVFNPFRMLAGLPINVDNIIVSGTKITMQSPQMAGFTPDRRPYEVSAKTAVQDVTNPNHVELQTLKAKIEMQDKSVVLMDARKGLFKSREQMLDLHEDILLRSSNYEARLTEAFVDMAKGTVVSNKPVEVKMLEGKLDAQRLEIVDRGALMTFDGGVKMILSPSPTNRNAAPADAKGVSK